MVKDSTRQQFFDPFFKQNLVLPQIYRFSSFIGDKDLPSLPKDITVNDLPLTSNKSIIRFSLDDDLSFLTMYYDSYNFSGKDTFNVKGLTFNFSDNKSIVTVDAINWDHPIISFSNGIQYEYLDSTQGLGTYTFTLESNVLYHEKDKDEYFVIVDNLTNIEDYYFGFIPQSHSFVRNYGQILNQNYPSGHSSYDVPPAPVESLTLVENTLHWGQVSIDLEKNSFENDVTYEIFGSLEDSPVNIDQFVSLGVTRELNYVLSDTTWKHYVVISRDENDSCVTLLSELKVI